MIRNMPKTAICISGQIRCLDMCIEQIRVNLLPHIPQYDIFVHTALDGDTHKAYLLDPKRLLAEKDIEMDEHRWQSYRGLRNIKGLLLQVWSLKQAYDLVQGDYGAVLRLRTDTRPLQPLDDMDFDNQSVFIPKADNYFGYNDRFAFGPTHLMAHYMTRFDRLNEFAIANNNMLHAETFLKWALDTRQVPVKRISMKLATARQNGDIDRSQSTKEYGDILT